MTIKQLDRYVGAMLGGLIGDCLGATFEFKFENLVPERKINAFLEDVKEMKADTDEKFQYTDDTAMARQIAVSYIENKSLELKAIAKRFADEYFHEPWRGYGGSVIEVFQKLKSSECSDPFKPASEQFDGSGSFGNGAGMRAHPIAVACARLAPSQIIEESKKVARLTHSHPLGVNGGVLQTLAVYYALNGYGSEELLIKLKEHVDILEENYKCDTASTYKHKLDLVEEFIVKPLDDIDEMCFELGNDVSAVDSVPTALFCFLKAVHDSKKAESNNDDLFEQVLHLAIRMGGDTDTIASMACSITGAYLGRHGIPTKFAMACEDSQQIEMMASQIFDIHEETTATNSKNVEPETKRQKLSNGENQQD